MKHSIPSTIGKRVLVFLWLLCLQANTASGQMGIIGTGTYSNTATTYPTPFGAYYAGQKTQYLYLASELTAAGIPPGYINSIGFYVTSLNSCGPHDTFAIKIAHTTATQLSSFSNSFIFTNQPIRIIPTIGWNTFMTPFGFVWNGTSNLIIEVCHWNGTSVSSFNASVAQSPIAPGLILSINYYSNTGGPFCSNLSLTPITYPTRPNIQINRLNSICAGQPTAGASIPSGTLAGCYKGIYTITDTGYTYAAYTRIRWKQSTDGGTTWVPAAGGSGDTTFSYTTPVLTDTISYHMVITCLTSGLSDSSANVTFNIAEPPYAALPVIESFEHWINACDSNNVPGINWTNTPSVGVQTWRRDDEGATGQWPQPDSGAYVPAARSGLHSARYHAFNTPVGSPAGQSLAAYVDCSPPGSKLLSFYLRTDPGTMLPNDSLYIDLSTNGGNTFSRVKAYGPGTGGWDFKSFLFTSVSPKTIISFRPASGRRGYTDIALDSVRVETLPLGIGKIAMASAFSIYPNPSRGAISISSSMEGLVELMDMPGRIVKSIVLATGGSNIHVRLGDLKPGLYTYRFTTKGQAAYIGKLVITP